MTELRFERRDRTQLLKNFGWMVGIQWQWVHHHRGFKAFNFQSLNTLKNFVTLLRDIANQGSETFVSFVTVFKKSCLCGLKQNKKQKSMYTANLPMTLYVHKSNFLLIYKRKHFKTNFSYNLY